jgi:hypothetical protein
LEDADLDGLASEWNGALDAAEDSLDAVGRCRALHFPPSDLRDRCNVLARERAETEKSLEELARTTNTHLHTSVVRRGAT